MLYNNSNIVKIHSYFDRFLSNMTTIEGVHWIAKSLNLIEDSLWNEDDHAEKNRLMNIFETYIVSYLNRCKEICKIQNYDPNSLEILKESIEIIRSYENTFRSKKNHLKSQIDETYNMIINAIPEEDQFISANKLIKLCYELPEEAKDQALLLLKELGINLNLFKYRENRYKQKGKNTTYQKTNEKGNEDQPNRAVFSDKSNVYEYRISGAIAKMVIKNGSYVILKGSTAIKENKPSMPESSKNKKIELISLRKMILDEKSDLYIFKENVPFNSPSMASGVISGTSTNGRLCFNTDRAK